VTGIVQLRKIILADNWVLVVELAFVVDLSFVGAAGDRRGLAAKNHPG
jgi:hypothetical protein